MKLSTGREIYTHRGIVGLGEDCMEPTEGYDGGIEAAHVTIPDGYDEADWNPLSTAEKLELADEMIRRWTVYRNAVLSNAQDQARMITNNKND